MNRVRQFVLVISCFLGVWVLVSFVGVMIDMNNVAFWTSSLLWSLMGSVFVMPGLMVMQSAGVRADRRTPKKTPGEDGAASSRPLPPFVRDEEHKEAVVFGQKTDATPEE